MSHILKPEIRSSHVVGINVLVGDLTTKCAETDRAGETVLRIESRSIICPEDALADLWRLGHRIAAAIDELEAELAGRD